MLYPKLFTVLSSRYGNEGYYPPPTIRVDSYNDEHGQRRGFFFAKDRILLSLTHLVDWRG